MRVRYHLRLDACPDGRLEVWASIYMVANHLEADTRDTIWGASVTFDLSVPNNELWFVDTSGVGFEPGIERLVSGWTDAWMVT